MQNNGILTDSQGPIKALRSNQVNPLIEELNTLDASNKTWIIWVPGRIELKGNETMDELEQKRG